MYVVHCTLYIIILNVDALMSVYCNIIYNNYNKTKKKTDGMNQRRV